ncbi:UNVERIFIED_CONTAM: hypothetical protein Sradi_1770200 [Sesamum radiatum]|uniref:Uncharacterized protein n=1 Tax=Sesamum radiatum TaxID=300843 RepID=A0AAW2TTN0_SESRA
MKKDCYLCNSDHRMRDYPKRGKLNALVAEADDDDEGGSSRGVACVDLKVGLWTGKCNLRVVPLDDFDVILGMDFMLLAHAMVMPYLSGLFIVDANCTSFVQGTYLQDFVRSMDKNDTLISALQVKNGLRHGEQTYLAALIEIKPDVVQEVPNEMTELLEEFKDVFPPELTQKLPPRWTLIMQSDWNLGKHGGEPS